ncbi:hypothetical protein F5Y10DRAFT_293140 [Nemania abortiva]|nr:hypothetical protein F5Y10DRAFT_293140 [Nemania abortiva]
MSSERDPTGELRGAADNLAGRMNLLAEFIEVDETQDYKKKLGFFSALLETMTTTSTRWENLVTSLYTEFEVNQAQLATSQAKFETEQQQLAASQAELKVSQEKLTTSQTAVEAERAQFEANRRELAQIQKQYFDGIQELRLSRQRFDEEARSRTQMTSNTIQQSLCSLRLSNEKVLSTLSKWFPEKRHAERPEAFEQAYQETKEELERKNIELDASRTEVSNVKKDLLNAQKELAAAQKTLSAAEKELNATRTNLSAAQTELLKTRAELREAKEANNRNEQAMESSTKKCAALHKDLDVVSGGLEHQIKERRSLALQLQEAKQAATQLRAEVTQIRDERDNLTARLASKDGSLNSSERKVAELETSLKSNEDKVKVLEAAHVAKDEKIERLEASIAYLAPKEKKDAGTQSALPGGGFKHILPRKRPRTDTDVGTDYTDHCNNQ